MDELKSNATSDVNENTNNENEVVEKVKKSDPLIVVAFRNIKYKFSYQPVLIYSFILAIVSALGYSFFLKQYSLFASDPEVVKSCFIMIVFFMFFLIFFAIVFITSLVLNIMRVVRERNEE